MAFDLPTNFTAANGSRVGVDGVGSLFQYASYATNDAFGTGLLLVIFIMTFGVSALLNIGRAFASAAFVTFIFSVYFARIDLISPVVPYFVFAATILGFFWARSERSNY